MNISSRWPDLRVTQRQISFNIFWLIKTELRVITVQIRFLSVSSLIIICIFSERLFLDNCRLTHHIIKLVQTKWILIIIYICRVLYFCVWKIKLILHALVVELLILNVDPIVELNILFRVAHGIVVALVGLHTSALVWCDTRTITKIIITILIW